MSISHIALIVNMVQYHCKHRSFIPFNVHPFIFIHPNTWYLRQKYRKLIKHTKYDSVPVQLESEESLKTL